MKKFFAVCTALICMVALVACGSQKPAEPVTYESDNGWSITYRPDVMKMTEKDGNVDFVYAGKDKDAGKVSISYEAGKMPQEALYDKIAGTDDSRVTRTEGKFGATGEWAFTYLVSPEKEGGFVEQFTGMEHNGGTLLLAMAIKDAEESKMMPVSDAIEELVNSLVLTNHEPQQQFSYVPGTYTRTYTEEMEGEDMTVTDTIVLNEDHTGIMDMQDSVPITWTSTHLITDGTGDRNEYTIEGDSLMVDQFNDGNWVTYNRAPKQQAGMANPFKEYASLDELNALNGGNLIKLFDDATDEKFFGTEIDGITMTEYQFTEGNQVYTFRCAPVMQDICGIYDNDGKTMFRDMAAFTGMQARYTDAYYIGRWFVDNMQYTLCCTHSEDEDAAAKEQTAFDELELRTVEAMGGDTNSEYDVNADYRLPEDQQKDQQVGMANPVQQMSESDMTQATGIDLPLPKEATDVTYSVINTGDAKIAQADFTLNGDKMYLRAVFTQMTSLAPEESADKTNLSFDTAKGDISGLNYKWDAGGTNLVQNRDAIVNVTKKGQGYVAWLDVVPGILYNLCMTENATVDKLVDTANAIFVPMQGES